MDADGVQLCGRMGDNRLDNSTHHTCYADQWRQYLEDSLRFICPILFKKLIVV